MEQYPDAIDTATNKVMEILENFKEVLDRLDREEVRKWVEDLVLVKTYLGLRVQEPILKYFATQLGENRLPIEFYFHFSLSRYSFIAPSHTIKQRVLGMRAEHHKWWLPLRYGVQLNLKRESKAFKQLLCFDFRGGCWH